MIGQWVDDMADAGADQYTFHLEATGQAWLSSEFINQRSLNLIDWLTHSGTINLQIHSKFLILIKLNAFPLLSDKPVDLINQIKKAGMKVL